MSIFARTMVRDFEGYAKLIASTDINTKNEDGASLLEVAIAFRSEDIALDLISRGIDIDHKDRNGMTELQSAFWMGLWKVGLELIKRGADLHHRTTNGNNALWYASTHPKVGYDVVRILAAPRSMPQSKEVKRL